MMGSAKEMVSRPTDFPYPALTTAQVGGSSGSDSMREGKEQHAEVGFLLSCYIFHPPLTIFLQGETEKKTAQTADAVHGLYTQIAGTANKLMGNTTKEASGELCFSDFVSYTSRSSPVLPFSSRRIPRVSSIPSTSCSPALTRVSRQRARNRRSGQEGGRQARLE
jgi:hypothetical protein